MKNKKTFVRVADTIIESGNSMKLLGFIFATTPCATEHIKYTLKKANSRMWLIINLVKAGWDKFSVLKIYVTCIRSIIEYCSSIYHSMLTLTQAKALEDTQKRALRIIFGWDKTYETLLETSGIVTLQTRRIRKHEAFAKKIETNKRFRDKWLIENTSEQHTRKHNKYILPKASTQRQTKNPVYSYISVLNNVYRR